MYQIDEDENDIDIDDFITNVLSLPPTIFIKKKRKKKATNFTSLYSFTDQLIKR